MQRAFKPVDVCVCVVQGMYVCKVWAGSQKVGWVHYVTAHVHSALSIPASLSMLHFSEMETFCVCVCVLRFHLCTVYIFTESCHIGKADVT